MLDWIFWFLFLDSYSWFCILFINTLKKITDWCICKAWSCYLAFQTRHTVSAVFTHQISFSNSEKKGGIMHQRDYFSLNRRLQVLFTKWWMIWCFISHFLITFLLTTSFMSKSFIKQTKNKLQNIIATSATYKYNINVVLRSNKFLYCIVTLIFLKTSGFSSIVTGTIGYWVELSGLASLIKLKHIGSSCIMTVHTQTILKSMT